MTDEYSISLSLFVQILNIFTRVVFKVLRPESDLIYTEK